MSTVLESTSTASRTKRRGGVIMYSPYVTQRPSSHRTIVRGSTQRSALRPVDLGWSRDKVVTTRRLLATFEDDWLSPEMDEYDAL